MGLPDEATMVTASGEVPPPLLFFTCLVCTGVMANFTLLVPVSTYYSSTLLESGVIVACYAGGAIISLYFWSTYDRRAVRPAYVVQGCLMCAGNCLFAIVAAAGLSPRATFYGLSVARFVVGLEAGCMYNANLALVGYSSAQHRVRYLATYQSFVGLGLVLGPAVSSSCLAVAQSFGSVVLEESLSAAVMAAWGLVVLALVATHLPSDADLERDYGRVFVSGLDDDAAAAEAISMSKRAGRGLLSVRQELLLEIFLGNLLRIYQCLGWEVGAVVVLAENYDWGYVAAGYALSSFGFFQALGQYVFSRRCASSHPVRTIHALEVLEAAAIAAMFTRTNATVGTALDASLCAVFLVASLLFYITNCLTSAPFNALVLERAVGIDKEDMMRASQYGIFVALGLVPIVVRGAMDYLASAKDHQDTLAGILLVGWALQTLVNSALTGRRGGAGPPEPPPEPDYGVLPDGEGAPLVAKGSAV